LAGAFVAGCAPPRMVGLLISQSRLASDPAARRAPFRAPRDSRQLSLIRLPNDHQVVFVVCAVVVMVMVLVLLLLAPQRNCLRLLVLLANNAQRSANDISYW
jgi:hypothetical protein